MSELDDLVDLKARETAEILFKERAVRKDKADTAYAAIEERKKNETLVQPTNFSTLVKPDLELAAYKHIEAISKNLPFITPELSEIVPIAPGQKYLLGALSGTGKTTMAAAMAYEMLKHSSETRILLISNEEREDIFCFRLGCLAGNLSINEFMSGKMPPDKHKAMVELSRIYQQRVDVIKSSKTSSVNGVMDILTAPGIENYSMVIIDYYQGISRMNELDSAAKTDVSKTVVLDNLKQRLTDLNPKYPLVLLAQLKPCPVDQLERGVESRIKWGTSIYEFADVVFEAINVPKMKAMELFIAKGRWGTSDQTYYCKFVDGLYVSLDEDDYLAYIASRKKDAIDAKNLIQVNNLTPEVSITL